MEKGSGKNSGIKLKDSSDNDLEENEGSGKNWEKGSGKSTDEIIEQLQKNSNFTIPELSKRLGISTRAVEKHINSLKKAGKLKRIGSRKKGWWKVIE